MRRHHYILLGSAYTLSALALVYFLFLTGPELDLPDDASSDPDREITGSTLTGESPAPLPSYVQDPTFPAGEALEADPPSQDLPPPVEDAIQFFKAHLADPDNAGVPLDALKIDQAIMIATDPDFQTFDILFSIQNWEEGRSSFEYNATVRHSLITGQYEVVMISTEPP